MMAMSAPLFPGGGAGGWANRFWVKPDPIALCAPTHIRLAILDLETLPTTPWGPSELDDLCLLCRQDPSNPGQLPPASLLPATPTSGLPCAQLLPSWGRQRSSTGGTFALVVCLRHLWWSHWGGEAAGFQWVGVGHAAELCTRTRRQPQRKNYSAQDVNRAEGWRTDQRLPFSKSLFKINK